MFEKVIFSHKLHEAATIDAVNNKDYGNCYTVAIAVHDAYVVQVTLPHFLLPVVVPYMWSPPATRASTLPVATIVVVQILNSYIYHYGKDSGTVQPRNDHTLPLESIIDQNKKYSNDY